MNAKPKKLFGFNRFRTALAIIAIALALHYMFPRYIVMTESMVPTMPPGTLAIAWRKSVIPSQIKMNDVVVFLPVEGVSPVPWIHRVMAVPGETIVPPREVGRVDITAPSGADFKKHEMSPLVLPESFFYQSGDASGSYHGLVPESAVVAKVLFHFKLPWK